MEPYDEMPKKNENVVIIKMDEIYKTSFGFNLTYIYTGVFMIPLFAFIFCLVLTFILHYDKSTATHCNVDNYLPSVSSAIGLIPQKYLWQFCIALQCSPRLFGAMLYHKFFRSFKSLPLVVLYFMFVVDVGENISLLFVSIVDSIHAHAQHVAGFVSFVVLSQLHMLLKLFVNGMIARDPMYSLNQRKSYKLKKKLWFINLLSVVLACLCFWVHNETCKPGVYTLFATCEYMMILSNMAFHATSYYEFHSSTVYVDVGGSYDDKTKPI